MKKNAAEFLCGELSLPSDFAERTHVVNARINSGEAMALQHIAEALGLPFEFVAACVGVMQALKTGKPVVIDPAQLPKLN